MAGPDRRSVPAIAAVVLGAAIVGCIIGGVVRDAYVARLGKQVSQRPAVGPDGLGHAVKGPVELPAGPEARRRVRMSDLLQRFDENAALEHVTKLADDIGPRYAGTPQEQHAAEYIRGVLTDLGYEVHLQKGIPVPPLSKVTQNVVGIKPGSSNALRIVVGGHYDSINRGGGSPGANDNGSGIGVVLEVARVLRRVKLPYRIDFVAFGSEESVDGVAAHHHYGSNHFVADYLESPGDPKLVGMMSVDMIGVGNDLYARTVGLANRILVDKSLASAERLGVPLEVLSGGAWSDHDAFELAGVPSVWYHRKEDPDYHTCRDVSANVESVHLRTMGRLVLHILLSLTEESLQEMSKLTGEPGASGDRKAPGS